MTLSKEYVKEAEDTVLRNLENKKFVIGPNHVQDRFKRTMDFINSHRKETLFILDVGSGAYMPIALDVSHATDISSIAGDILEQSGWGGIFRVAPSHKLPFRNDTFGMAVCCEVIEHLPDIELVKQTFSEINRVAKRWLVTTPCASASGVRDEWNIETTHRQFFTAQDIIDLTKDYETEVKVYDKHIFCYSPGP